MTFFSPINQGLLAVNHQVVITRIAAYDDVADIDKGMDGIMVKCVALDESHLRGGGDGIRNLARITAVAASSDIRAFQDIRYESFRKFANDTQQYQQWKSWRILDARNVSQKGDIGERNSSLRNRGC